MTKVTPRRVCSASYELESLDLLLVSAKAVYADLCDALERADQDDNEYCLLLSNGADDIDSLISGMERVQEART
jgi:hypothetical protein